MRKLLMGVAVLSSLALVGVAASPAAVAKTHKNSDPTVYDSIVDPNPGNLPSVGFEATQGYEIGNQIDLAPGGSVLDNVVVQMSSWGCQQGGAYGTFAYAPDSIAQTDPCVSTPGSTFSEPITLTVYNAPTSGSEASPSGTLVVPGTVLATDTQTFNISYRPSADPNFATDCAADATEYDQSIGSFDGTWYDGATDPTTGNPYGCLNGFIDNVTFNFGHVILPSSVVYGISYNTSDYGTPAYGDNTACHATQEGCGYDSLNVGLSDEPGSPSVGSDPNPGTIFWDSTDAGFYCDSGAAGSSVFRLDSPGTGNQCWSPYIPAVEFNGVANPAATITSGNMAAIVAGSAFSFTVTTDGVPVPTLSKGAGRLPKGLTFVSNGNGTATISTPGASVVPTTDRNGTYHFVVKARNGRHSIAKQVVYFTLTGGKA
jgi:hypothetical protein